MTRLSFRALSALGFLACAFGMAFALYLQHAKGFEPCPMCIFQRIAMTGAAVFFLLGALLVWIPAIGTRYRARRAEKKVVALETKLADYAKAPPGVKLLAGPR